METCINYADKRVETDLNICDLENEKLAFFSSDERKFINKIHKLKEEHPLEVNVIREPEVNHGTIYCTFPRDWFKIQPPRKVSEEQKEKLRENAFKKKAN